MRPTEFQKKVWFNALTAVCIVVIGTILVGSIWLSGEILAYLQPVLVPLAVAGIFAYLIDPIVNWLEKKGLSRMKAIIAVFIMGAISIAGFTVLLKQPLEDQVSHNLWRGNERVDLLDDNEDGQDDDDINPSIIANELSDPDF